MADASGGPALLPVTIRHFDQAPLDVSCVEVKLSPDESLFGTYHWRANTYPHKGLAIVIVQNG
jgi:hypothetical protein